MDCKLLVFFDDSLLDGVKHDVWLDNAPITQRHELIFCVFVAESIGVGKKDVWPFLVLVLDSTAQRHA